MEEATISPGEPVAQVNIAGMKGEFSTIQQHQSPPNEMMQTGFGVKGSSPNRTYQMKHHQAMTTVQYGDNAHCDEYVSPYSILRGSTDADVERTIQKLQLSAN